MALGVSLSSWILHIFWTDRPRILLYNLFMLSMGTIILAYFSYLIERADRSKKIKYEICKEIEQEYKFIGQHKKLNNLTFLQNDLFPMGFGIYIFRFLKIILLIIYGFSIIWCLGLIAMYGKVNEVIINFTKFMVVLIFIVLLFDIMSWIDSKKYKLRQ